MKTIIPFNRFNENTASVDEREYLVLKIKEYMTDFIICNRNSVYFLEDNNLKIDNKEVSFLTRNSVFFIDDSYENFDHLNKEDLNKILDVLKADSGK